jgi:xylitol oxidase
MRERNWAGNVTYRARHIHRPATVAELQQLVAASSELHVLGSRHSFNTIADASELVSLDALAAEIEIDPAGTVTCPASITYGVLARRLHADGLALANLASLPHISVAGTIATATHGSGDELGNLATAVTALELVTSAGELIEVRRGDPDFEGVVVGLGALGAVTRVTLAVEPAYEVEQTVYTPLSWAALEEHFDEITAVGTSVSVFTTWGEHAGALWVKRRLDRLGGPAPARRFGAPAATGPLHPIAGADPAACTTQGGVPGPWHERLPHFRPDFTPSAGDELQSEYLLPREHARAAIAASRALAPRIRPLLHVSEIRTVAADDLWLSPQHGRESVSLHFTWRREPERVLPLLGELEAALEPFQPRPHWGKLFAARAAELAPRYARRDDFVALQGRLDPRGAFRNEWLRERILGGRAPGAS